MSTTPNAGQPATPLMVGAVSGAAGGIAYLAEMAIDLKLFDSRLDDLVLLAGTFVSDDAAARRLGAVIHLGNSVLVGIAYERAVRGRLMGPGWLRGVTFASIENLGLYTMVRLESFHPAVKSGRIDRYSTRKAFVQNVLRHIAFGAVMGWTADRLRSRERVYF